MTNHAIFIWCVKCKTTTGLVCSRGERGGGGHFSKTFSIFYMLNNKHRVFSPYFSVCTFPMKKHFVDNSRVEPTFFFIERKTFSLKLLSGHFYGQSFIKTVLTNKCVLTTIFAVFAVIQGITANKFTHYKSHLSSILEESK